MVHFTFDPQAPEFFPPGPLVCRSTPEEYRPAWTPPPVVPDSGCLAPFVPVSRPTSSPTYHSGQQTPRHHFTYQELHDLLPCLESNRVEALMRYINRPGMFEEVGPGTYKAVHRC